MAGIIIIEQSAAIPPNVFKGITTVISASFNDSIGIQRASISGHAYYYAPPALLPASRPVYESHSRQRQRQTSSALTLLA